MSLARDKVLGSYVPDTFSPGFFRRHDGDRGEVEHKVGWGAGTRRVRKIYARVCCMLLTLIRVI